MKGRHTVTMRHVSFSQKQYVALISIQRRRKQASLLTRRPGEGRKQSGTLRKFDKRDPDAIWRLPAPRLKMLVLVSQAIKEMGQSIG